MSKRRLTELQVAAIAILALPKRGGLTFKQVAEQVGVSEQSIHNWRKKDYFNEELKRQIVRNTLDDLPEMMSSASKHVIDEGNAAMFRTLLQAHGMLTDKVDVTTESKADNKAEIRAKLAELQAEREADK